VGELLQRNGRERRYRHGRARGCNAGLAARVPSSWEGPCGSSQQNWVCSLAVPFEGARRGAVTGTAEHVPIEVNCKSFSSCPQAYDPRARQNRQDGDKQLELCAFKTRHTSLLYRHAQPQLVIEGKRGQRRQRAGRAARRNMGYLVQRHPAPARHDSRRRAPVRMETDIRTRDALPSATRSGTASPANTERTDPDGARDVGDATGQLALHLNTVDQGILLVPIC